MRNAIAAVGGPPIFERPLQIVRPVFPDVNKFLAPFQAALAQAQFTLVQLAQPAPISTRNAIALEILWISGLAVAYWWTK